MSIEAIKHYEAALLEAFPRGATGDVFEHWNKARIAIAEAQKQEPFEYWNAVEGWVKLDEVREHFHSVSCGTIYKNEGEGRVPLYANPQPKREWVGLTDEEIYDYADKFLYQHGSNYGIKSFGKAIEAKLKQKNGYAEEKNNG